LTVVTLFVRVPDDRVGAVIGTEGSTRSEIEHRTATQLAIDAANGEVTVSAPDTADPLGALQARDIVVAIGRGFAPARAFRLLNDDTYLGLIDIKSVTGRREKAALWRIRSRLIGTDGKARRRIEELSGCSMSVYRNTVALIGKEPELERGTRAVELLLRGSEHSVVFRMLARLRREEALAEATTVPELADGE
jgi:ribosomal RNA assembly protein